MAGCRLQVEKTVGGKDDEQNQQPKEDKTRTALFRDRGEPFWGG